MTMKLPNGYGSVYKLKGNRRKPWAARITESHDENYHMKYRYIGYYESQAEALAALAEYHTDPHKLDSHNITFEEVYRMWSNEHYPKIKYTTINGYKRSYKACSMIYNMPFHEIRRAHLQNIADTSGKNYGELKVLKVFMGALYKFAIQNDITDKNYAQFVDITQYKKRNPNARPHKVFSDDEIDSLWKNADSEVIKTVLILIYTGVRISELLNLKAEDINLNERYFDVKTSKTINGIRTVPIAEKIAPFFEYFLSKNGTYLLSENGQKLKYHEYELYKWKPLIKEHTPHDTRHTCVSLMTAKKVDERVIRKIVGHSGKSLTESVYTHIDLEQMQEAINRI